MGTVSIYLWFLLASFLISLRVYFRRQPDNVYLRFFPPMLLLTMIVELTGAYIAFQRKPNIILYNYFSMFWMCYYLFTISLMISSIKVKKIIWVTSTIYFILVFSKFTFIDKLNPTKWNTVPHSLGFLIIVIFCVYFFYELFKMPKYVNLKTNPAFWICSGLLFFCSCGFPLWGFWNFWVKMPFMVKNFTAIILVLNIFLYSLFAIGFLCQRTPKYTLSSS